MKLMLPRAMNFLNNLPYFELEFFILRSIQYVLDFQARRRVSINEIPTKDEEQEALAGTESLGRESLDTSIEAQADNSVKTFSIPEESITAHNWLQQKSRAHILKIKVNQKIA